MTKRMIFKKTMIFVMVFSLVFTITMPKAEPKAVAPLVVYGALVALNLFFIAQDVKDCWEAEDKFTGCVVPFVVNFISSSTPAKVLNVLSKKFLMKLPTTKLAIKELFGKATINTTFEEFKKAKDLVIGKYSVLREVKKGAGLTLQAHHIFEQRFAKAIDIKPNDMISVVLHKDVHQKISNRWRAAIPYGTKWGNSLKDLKKYIKLMNKVYYDLPALRTLGKYQIYSSKAFLKKVGLQLGITNSVSILYHSFKKPNNLSIEQSATYEKLKRFFNKNFAKDNNLDVRNPETVNAIRNFNEQQFEQELKEEFGIDLIAPALEGNKETLKDITSQFGDKSIRVKSAYTGRALQIDDTYSVLHANYEPSDQEISFRTKLTPDGWLGFQRSNGKWLSVSDTITSTLKVNTDALWEWECFRVYTDGSYHYLLSQKTKKLLNVSLEPSGPIFADGENEERARFFLEDINQKAAIGLKAPDTGLPEGWLPENNPGKTDIQSYQNETYVKNRFYFFSNYIRGHYTGSFRNGNPHGEGTLVYDDASSFKKNGGIKYSGSFQNGIPMGRGQRHHQEYILDGEFFGLFEKDKKVFEGKITFTSGPDTGRTYTVKQIAISQDAFEWEDWNDITYQESPLESKEAYHTEDTFESLQEELKNIPETETVYYEGEHLDEGFLPDNKPSIKYHEETSSYQPAVVSPSIYQPSRGDYVSNKFYYFSDYIRGHYTGDWENGRPSGSGTLVYDDASLHRKKNRIKYSGKWKNGIPYGRGIRYEVGGYWEGIWYGLYQAGQVYFEGEVHYDTGEVCKGQVVATSPNDGIWISSDD